MGSAQANSLDPIDLSDFGSSTHSLYNIGEMTSAPARLKTIIVSPKSGVVPTASLIFAHGLGDSGAGWTDVAEMLTARPSLRHLRVILPNAPMQPVSLNFGQQVSRSQSSLYTYPSADMLI